MLAFLKRIRKSLVASGSVRKYLIYAIGEIALVVIGILLALAINNWRLEQSNLNLERTYLESLLIDIQTDIENIDRYKTSALENIAKPLERAYENFILNEPEKIDTFQFINDLTFVSFMNIIPFRKGTYRDLMSTGNLKIIRDQELKSTLQDYIEKAEYYSLYYEGMLDFKTRATEIIGAYVPRRYSAYGLEYLNKNDSQEIEIDITSLLNNMELENTIISALATTDWIDNSHNDMFERAKEIEVLLKSLLD